MNVNNNSKTIAYTIVHGILKTFFFTSDSGDSVTVYWLITFFYHVYTFSVGFFDCSDLLLNFRFFSSLANFSFYPSPSHVSLLCQSFTCFFKNILDLWLYNECSPTLSKCRVLIVRYADNGSCQKKLYHKYRFFL